MRRVSRLLLLTLILNGCGHLSGSGGDTDGKICIPRSEAEKCLVCATELDAERAEKTDCVQNMQADGAILGWKTIATMVATAFGAGVYIGHEVSK